MKKALVLLFCLGLYGCATTAKYEAKLNNFIGVGEDSLIASWGVPDKQYSMKDGKKAVMYLNKTTVQTGGDTHTEERTVYHSGTIGNEPYSGTSTQYVTETTPVEKYKLVCKTSFVINKEGIVESWHHEGNNCVSNR